MSSRHVAYAFVTALAVACGGAVNQDDDENGGRGGTSSGGRTSGGASGAVSGGASQGGAAATAGAVFGGAGPNGGSAGSFGAQAGVGALGGTAGAPPFNPACPARIPGVVLLPADAAIPAPRPACMPLGMTCTYDPFTTCLCAQNGTYGCSPVDPQCPTLQAENADRAAPPGAGIALPPNATCTCTLSGWVCAAPF